MIYEAVEELEKFKNGGKIKVDNSFTQTRKDAALWFTDSNGGFSAADKYFDPPAQPIFKAATSQEFDGFYTYTAGSGGHNRPLAGFQKPYYESGTGWEAKYNVGAKKVSPTCCDAIPNMTTVYGKGGDRFCNSECCDSGKIKDGFENFQNGDMD